MLCLKKNAKRVQWIKHELYTVEWKENMMLNIYSLDKHCPFCSLSKSGIQGGIDIIIVETQTGAIPNTLRQLYSQDHLFS